VDPAARVCQRRILTGEVRRGECAPHRTAVILPIWPVPFTTKYDLRARRPSLRSASRRRATGVVLANRPPRSPVITTSPPLEPRRVRAPALIEITSIENSR
jgi:hypothetical protein